MAVGAWIPCSSWFSFVPLLRWSGMLGGLGLELNIHEHLIQPSAYPLFRIATSSSLHFASGQSGRLPRHVQSCNNVSEGQQYLPESTVSLLSPCCRVITHCGDG